MRYLPRRKWMLPVLVPMWLIVGVACPDIRWAYGEILHRHEAELW